MESKNKNIGKIVFFIFLLIYTISLVFLYYNQLKYPITGRFESDTAVHVDFAINQHYYHSLAAFIYLFLSIFKFSDILIALVLAIATSITVFFTFKLLKAFNEHFKGEVNDNILYVVSFFANFVMGFYIKAANKQHYIGYENANMWHNSTYVFMRLFAVLTIIAFLKLYLNYKEKIDVKDYLIYTLLLTVTTGFKASFLTVFAPMLAIILLVDLCKGTKFKNVFIMALSVVLPMGVMVLQSIVMSGSDNSNGYTISPFTALAMRGDHPKATLILSVLFPLIVLFTHVKDFYKDKLYFGTLIMWAVSFLEVFLLLETGERNLDSNFFWGYSIALFFVFLVSMYVAIKDYLKNKPKLSAKIILSLETVILLWHVYSGVWYFVLLFSGVTYFV
jgi:hypothetical protein